MRYAIIENKEVVNVIVADQEFIDAHYPNAIECDDLVSVGWNYDKKKFIAPKPNIAIIDETLAE
jgi:hypothetical protein